jgi:RNA polymerase sigma-70 factor (ECF subfamily)
VIEGAIDVLTGDRTQTVGESEFIFISGGTPLGFRDIDREARQYPRPRQDDRHRRPARSSCRRTTAGAMTTAASWRFPRRFDECSAAVNRASAYSRSRMLELSNIETAIARSRVARHDAAPRRRRVVQTRSPLPNLRNTMLLPVDRRLVARAARRERSALDALVSTLVPHIEYQLLRYPVDDEDRRDLLQSTIIQVVAHIGSFRGDAAFTTWVYRVCANEAFMLMRSHRRRRARLVEGVDSEELERLSAADEASASTGADLAASDHVRNEVVRSAIAGLPTHLRELVNLYYSKDLALQEIADRLSLTESAVRSRLHRARDRLREVLARSPVVAEACGNDVRQEVTPAFARVAAA